MSRTRPLDKNKATPHVKEIFGQIESKLGKIPNIFLHLGNSEAALKGFMDLSDAAGRTSLDPRLREKIALTVGQTNNCNYCLSAHTAIAKGFGLQESDILEARQSHTADPKSQAILQFAKTVVEKRGLVDEKNISDLKAAGVDDKEITEIILVIMVNMFTNYFNHITDPVIDFPVAPELY